MRKSCLVLALLFGAPHGPLWAQAAPVNFNLEFSAERQRLSNGAPDWRESVVKVYRTQGMRERAELSWTQSDRFDLRDEQLGGAYVQALTDGLTVSLEATLSPTHQFLPSRSLGALLQYEFAPAWLIHTGLKSRHYTDTAIQQETLMLEHYVAAFSWALAWRPVQALGSQSSSTELRAAYYYGDKSSLGLSVSSGQEATQASTSAIELVEVRSLALNGRHQLNRDWTFNYGVSSTTQGSFYTRNGLLIGVHYIF
jgi:YaiO family outer membrane protein